LIKVKEVELLDIRGEDQAADIFTKALKKDVFLKLRKLLDTCSMVELN